jgi:CAAX protease family protein
VEATVSAARPFDRLRACVYFVIAAVYFHFARLLAEVASRGLGAGPDNSILRQLIWLFLLLVGYAGMGYAFQQQTKPLVAMGLVRRKTGPREFAIGVALGWGMIVACVLPIAIFGGLAISFSHDLASWKLLLADVVVLLFAALGEEIGFRGYPFQRLIDAVGPTGASLLMAIFFAAVHARNPWSSRMSLVVTFLSGLLLSMAYLRTRALWLPWGLHFSWNAAMGLLFGLPVSGVSDFSPVVVSDAMGPLWLTGGGYGPEASLLAVIVIFASLFVLYRVTRDYAFQYAQPVIVSGGIPVDVPPPSQHHSMVSSQPSNNSGNSGLIQIQSASTALPSKPLSEDLTVIHTPETIVSPEKPQS